MAGRRCFADRWGSGRTAGDRDAVSLWDVAARSIGHCGRGGEALFTTLCLDAAAGIDGTGRRNWRRRRCDNWDTFVCSPASDRRYR